MRWMTAVLLATLLVSPLTAAAETEAEYNDPIYGFSLKAPAIGSSEAGPIVQRLMVFGAAADGFAPNCNVQIQQSLGTLDKYMEISEEQLESANLALATKKSTRVSGLPAFEFEYAGPMGGQDLTFLAVVAQRNERVWLLTCTGLTSTFHQVRPDFERVIESFEIHPPE